MISVKKEKQEEERTIPLFTTKQTIAMNAERLSHLESLDNLFDYIADDFVWNAPKFMFGLFPFSYPQQSNARPLAFKAYLVFEFTD